MMPRIEATEALAAINSAALAAGAGEATERERIFAELQRKATGAPKPVPAKAEPADLAAMGIGVANAEDVPVIGDLDAWLGGSDG